MLFSLMPFRQTEYNALGGGGSGDLKPRRNARPRPATRNSSAMEEGLFLRSALRTSRLAGVCLCALLCLYGAGCNRKKVIKLDPRFSYNVVRVPSWFPEDEAQLSPAQREVLQRFGRPDFIRFWWNPEGTFIVSSDLAGKQAEVPQMLHAAKQTWIYLTDRKTEVEFRGESYFPHPVTEKLALVCRYGDPSQKNPPKRGPDGRVRESWRWTDFGLLIDFIDDQEVSRKHFTPTGSGTVLLK
jgi:hypothetical protein